MNNKLFLLVTVLTFTKCYAMEEELKKKQEPAIFLDDCPVRYVSKSNYYRNRSERIFGTTFPLNTPFFEVGFENVGDILEREASINQRIRPDLVPHQYIKDAQEGDYIELKLVGTIYSFLCKQDYAYNNEGKKFEEVRQMLFETFLQQANWRLDSSQWTLFENKIITDDGTKHGENGTPYAFKN